MEGGGTNGNPAVDRLACKCLLHLASRPKQTIAEQIGHVFLNCGSQVRVLPGTPLVGLIMRMPLIEPQAPRVTLG